MRRCVFSFFKNFDVRFFLSVKKLRCIGILGGKVPQILLGSTAFHQNLLMSRSLEISTHVWVRWEILECLIMKACGAVFIEFKINEMRFVKIFAIMKKL